MNRLASLVFLLLLPGYQHAAPVLTDCELSGFKQTPRYAETIAFVKRLAAVSPWMRYESFGVSPAGRDLPLVICDSRRRFQPSSTRPVILVFNGIHAGEIEGKDACLMLLRDLTAHAYREWLDHAILLIVPILNVDGHERFGPYNRPNQNGPEGGMGFRVSAEGVNLNRDWMKLETPECRALVQVYNRWKPQMVVDMHTSDGQDFQYDLQYLWSVHPSTPQIKLTYQKELLARLTSQMRDRGHKMSPYLGLEDPTDPASGVKLWPPSPRFSTSYFDLRGAMSILIETHADKDYKTRVLAARDFLELLFTAVSKEPEKLMAACRDVRRDTVAARPGAPFAIEMETGEEKLPFTYEGWEMSARTSEVTGRKVPVYSTIPQSYETTIQEDVKVVKLVTVPTAYVLEPGMSRIVQKLQQHGITVQKLRVPTEIEVEAHRVQSIEFQQRPYQGHHPVKATFSVEKTKRRFEAGSYVVPGIQPETPCLMYLVEPESGEGLMYWNYFDWIVEEKESPEDRTMENWAVEMLKDPEVRKAYDDRLRSDAEFSKDPEKRLHFFYTKSPYFDREVGLYPVFRYAGPPLTEVTTVP